MKKYTAILILLPLLLASGPILTVNVLSTSTSTTMNHHTSLEESQSPVLPTPTISTYQGASNALTGTTTASVSRGFSPGSTAAGSNTFSEGPPSGFMNSHINCYIDDVYRLYYHTGHVENYDLTLDPRPWGTKEWYHHDTIGVGPYEVAFDWNPLGWVWHQVYTTGLGDSSAGGSEFMSDILMQWVGRDVREATLYFRYRCRWLIPGGTTIPASRVYIELLTDNGVYYPLDTFYGLKTADEDTGWIPVSMNVTDWFAPWSQGYFYLGMQAETNNNIFSTSVFEVSWDYIYLDITYEEPGLPEIVSLYDSTSGSYAFNSSGYVDLDTTNTQWTFQTGVAETVAFNYRYWVDAQGTEIAVTTFAVEPGGKANWTVTYTPLAAGGDWSTLGYEITVPDSWTYIQSEVGTNPTWDEPNHMLTAEVGGWHEFTDPNIAIAEITTAQQYLGTIIRSPCTFLMRGEQYALTPTGTAGEYFLDVYNSTDLVDSGNAWIGTGEIWYQNSTNDYLTIGSRDELGSYTAAVRYRNATQPLHVGYKTTTFQVETYSLASVTYNTQLDGTLDISGQIAENGTGDLNIYVASARVITPAFDTPIGYSLTNHLTLNHLILDDCLIDLAGEEINPWFTITSSADLVDIEVEMRFVSLAGSNFTIARRSDLVSFSNGETKTFNWINTMINSVGFNTTLRSGVYRIQFLISGPETGSVHLDEILPGCYLIVIEQLVDGRVIALHQADITYPDFSTTFHQSECEVPGETTFILAVEDTNHITLETPEASVIPYKLHTHIADPSCPVHEDGSVTVKATLMGNAPRFSDYTYTGKTFDLDFLIDWGSGYELLTTETVSINTTASYEITTPGGHSPGVYGIRVEFAGDDDLESCYSQTSLSFETTTITIVSNDLLQGTAGVFEARLAGETIGPLEGYSLQFEIFDGNTWNSIGSAETNATGWASVTYVTDLPLGSYDVRVSFAGYNFLLSSTADNSFNVTQIMTPDLTILLIIGGAVGITVVVIIVGYALLRRRGSNPA